MRCQPSHLTTFKQPRGDLAGFLKRLKQPSTPFINQLKGTMTLSSVHALPQWVRIELNRYLGGQKAKNKSSPNFHAVRAYAALAGSPLEALLGGIELFMDVFPRIEPGDLNYRVHPLGIDGRPNGRDFSRADDKEIVDQKILLRSTSRNLPLKNFTAFFSFEGLPWMFSEVIQVRSATHAALALLHRTRTAPFDFVEPCNAFNIYEGIHVPVDYGGKEYFPLDGFRYEAFKGIPVVDEEAGPKEGFTIVEHALESSSRYVAMREEKMPTLKSSQTASFTLAGKVVDLVPEINRTLYTWEVHKHGRVRCMELPDTYESWEDKEKADSEQADSQSLSSKES